MDLKSNVNDFIDMLNKGKYLEAFEKYYADNVVMQENNDAPRIGKTANLEAQKDFISKVSAIHDSKVRHVAFNPEENVAMLQEYMDLEMKGAGRVQMEEVAVQTWKDGKIVNEKFFYKQ